MGIWSKASRTHVAHMDKGDFFSSEQSTTMKDATEVSIEHIAPDGTVTVLKGSTKASSMCSIQLRVCFVSVYYVPNRQMIFVSSIITFSIAKCSHRSSLYFEMPPPFPSIFKYSHQISTFKLPTSPSRNCFWNARPIFSSRIVIQSPGTKHFYITCTGWCVLNIVFMSPRFHYRFCTTVTVSISQLKNSHNEKKSFTL